MNNEQFRRLLQENENRDARSGTRSNENETNEHRDGGAGGGATPGVALGSRMRSSIPMTPRSVTGVNFAHQLAEHRREGQQQPPTKRFKSSAAPKGTRLPTGYQDRASQRQTIPQENAGGAGAGAGADIEERVAALEELVKLGQIDQGTFDKLRAELGVGGDVKSTHMVKGLDWDLLRRVKAGEDVAKVPEKTPADEEEDDGKGDAPEEEEVDLEAEFERVTEEKGQEAVAPVAPKEKKEKKGTMAPPPPPTQQKKSRNELLQELKASRAAAAAAPPPPAPAEPVLGSRFKKLSESRPEKKRWVEHDENGRRREVLLVTDTQGNTKRKTRWLDKPGEPRGLLVPDKGVQPLGMEVPPAAAAPVEDDDGDIFEGVGADYNPLADIGGGDDASSSESDEGEVAEPRAKKPAPTVPSAPPPSKPRNYFATSGPDETAEADEDQGQTRANPLTRDPSLLAALKRAAALRQTAPSGGTGGEGGDTGRGQRFLQEMRRREAQDAEDMDLGFGGSRVGDEEDEEPLVFEGDGRGGQKRKRGPKKKTGDKEKVSDVMRVLDGRKKS